MEDLCDFGLCEAKVSDADSLHLELDNDSDNNMANTNRPSSTVSFASWTFSPIQEDSVKTVDNNKMLVDERQQLYIMASPCDSQPSRVAKNQEELLQPRPATSQSYFPNTISYHHYANIHNYVGNNCGQVTPMRGYSCMHEGLGSMPESCGSGSMRWGGQDTRPTLPPKATDYRCSTPDYLVALNSQLHSPPKPNHSAAMDFSYTASFEDIINQSSSLKHQDSGYNSDLNVSPVIQYQDNCDKLNNKHTVRRDTSTPNSHHQYLTTAPMYKDSVAPEQHPSLPQQLASVMPGFRSKGCVFLQNSYPLNLSGTPQLTVPSQIHKPELHKLVQRASVVTVSDRTDNKINKNEPPKCKPKSEPTSRKTKQNSEVSVNSGGRRRHNEPLNNTALEVMNEWYLTHKENPYPTKTEKEHLAKVGGISISQVKSWFANKRNRNNNTRPKKQKQVMSERLLDLCHELARDARAPNNDHAYYIQQLAAIIDTTRAPHS